MSGSRLPRSSQASVHPRLESVVRRHLDSPWRQPVRSHNRVAFESIAERAAAAPSLVLDSGCGTGQSTLRLAEVHDSALVIGVDKSEHRLSRRPALPHNAVLLRADLVDFWRLARAARWRLAHHYLFYPNPWPKPGQLQRRWHGHPAFPDLMALGGRLELRTNFRLYAMEMARALQIAGNHTVEMLSLNIREPVSPFEAKYAASGHALYRLIAELQGEST